METFKRTIIVIFLNLGLTSFFWGAAVLIVSLIVAKRPADRAIIPFAVIGFVFFGGIVGGISGGIIGLLNASLLLSALIGTLISLFSVTAFFLQGGRGGIDSTSVFSFFVVPSLLGATASFLSVVLLNKLLLLRTE